MFESDVESYRMPQNKKIEEKEILDKFLSSEIGKKWYKKYHFQGYYEAEQPDFIFLTNNNKKIGLEITQFIIKSKHGAALQSLRRVGNKACKYALDKYNLQLSMIIDRCDPRKFRQFTHQELLELLYNPGFTVRFDENEVKTRIEHIIDNNLEELKTFPSLVKRWIEIEDEKLIITLSGFPHIDGKYDCTVNNQCFSAQDPFDDLQFEIDKKNKKFEYYFKKCDKCFLLIDIPDVTKGNYCHFSGKLKWKLFSSKFKSIFCYNETSKECFLLKKKLF